METINFSGMTRAATLTALGNIGVEGDAAEAILRETAPMRHLARIQATHNAAFAAGEGSYALAVLVLAADILGVGGHDGIEGAGTARHPAFKHLGNGRWHASDGGAYRAAAEWSLRTLCITAAGLDPAGEDYPYVELFAGTEGGLGWSVTITADGPGGPDRDGKHRGVYEAEVLFSAPALQGEGLAWTRTLTRVGLRASLGLRGGGPGGAHFPGHVPVKFLGSPRAWGAMVNATEARLRGEPAPVIAAPAGPVVVDAGPLSPEEREALSRALEGYDSEELAELLQAEALIVTMEDARDAECCAEGANEFARKYLGGAHEATGAAVLRGGLMDPRNACYYAAKAVFQAAKRVAGAL